MASNRYQHTQFREESPRRQPARPNGGKRRKTLLHNQTDNTRAGDQRRYKAKTTPEDSLIGDVIEIDEVPAPSYLTPNQKSIYDKILPVVLEIKYIKRSDIFLLTEFCGYYAQYIDLCEIIADEGMLIATEKGEKLHPLLNQRHKMFSTFLTLASQFGFTPASRKRMLAAVAKETENEVETVDPEEEEWDELLH